MVKYPILLIDIDKILKRELITLSVAKPILDFEQDRLKENRRYIGCKFCDSNGDEFRLSHIKVIGKSKSLWRAVAFNKFRLLDKVEFELKKTNKNYSIEELKTIAKELMKLETIEEAQQEYCGYIEKGQSYEDIIGNFCLFLQG